MSGEPKWPRGPWNLVWWGNETYPFPLSILANNDGKWVARDGTVSSEAIAHLIAAAPDLYAALETILYENSDKPQMERTTDRVRATMALAKARGDTP